MEFSQIDIHELLPQQEPFVMVGSLHHFDMVKTVTQTNISANNIFVEDHKFTSSGIIENIAQTCAARIGYINKYILKKGIQIGFIGAVRKLKISRFPKVGEDILTSINVIEEVFGMILAEAEVKIGEETIATSEIKIALSDKEV